MQEVRALLSLAPVSKISEAIKEHAAEFSNKQDVWDFITKLGEQLTGAAFTGELKDAYKLVAETSDAYQGIPGLGRVGQWVKENGADFFAKPVHTVETYEAPDDDPFAIYSSALTSALTPQRKMVKKQRWVITGVDCTAETPFKSVRMTAFPSYENLPHAVAVIVFVFSKKDCVLFYMFQTVKELDWGKLAALDSRKWSYMSVVMKRDTGATRTATDLVQRFENFLTKIAREKLGLIDEAKEAQPVVEKSDAKAKKQ